MAVNPRHEADPIEIALTSLIDLHGPSLLFESDRLESDLRDLCPDAEREISVLLTALDEEVPQDLLSVHTDEDLQGHLPRLAQRLTERKGLSPGASNWAVRTWARSLGLAVFATGALPDILYVPAVVPRAVGVRIETEADGADAELGEFLPRRQARAATEGRRFNQSNLWITMVAAAVALIAIWFGSFYYKLAITRVATTEPLVGDGRERDVFVSFESSRVGVESVQIRFVRGDGPWDRQPSTVHVSREAASKGRTPAGRISMRTAKPANATFEYVLLAADGKRSAPFEKTFEIAPGPALPPVITEIDVPPIVAGRPFALTIDYGQGTGRVAEIERKVIASTTTWKPEARMTLTPGLADTKAGTLSYPFEPIGMASQSTVQFTLLDGDGVRSQPKSVVLDVAAPSARAVPSTRVASSARAVSPDRVAPSNRIAPSDGVVAPGRVVSSPRSNPSVRNASKGCTGATCGRVVAVREVAAQPEESGLGAAASALFGKLFGRPNDRPPKLYQITVRMDNGTTRVMTKTTRMQNGARVRVAGNTIVAARS